MTISWIHSTVKYPAKFIFLAAMNPCPCGYLESDSHYCTCSENQIKAYKNKDSGPILDRIDIMLSLEVVNIKGMIFAKMNYLKRLEEESLLPGKGNTKIGKERLIG